MHRLITSILLLLNSELALAIDCSQANITLDTQAGVDTFQAVYGGGGTCDTITGSLVIRSGDITDLSPLSDLTFIGDKLSIETHSLANVESLINISHVGKKLFIENTRNLTGLNGLSSITTAGIWLRVANNADLENLVGLSGLTSIGSGSPNFNKFDIVNNPSLASLSGLENVTAVDGPFYLWGNDSLSDITGLANVSELQSLRMEYNPALTNLNGLGGISEIYSLEMRNNDNLSDLSALSNLSSITSGLHLSSNESVSSLQAFANVTSIGASGFSLRDMPLISDLDDLASIQEIRGQIRIESNAALASIAGLNNVVSESNPTRIQHFRIIGNPSLTDLGNFTSVTSILGGLVIENNDALINIAGFSQLSGELQFLQIVGNDSLTALGALQGVDTIAVNGSPSTDTLISNNSELLNINELSNLTGIEGTTRIESNAKLQNLDGLSNLVSIAGDIIFDGDFHVENNPQLADCGGLALLVDSIDHGEAGPGPGFSGIPDVHNAVIISNNLPGCNSVEEILSGPKLLEPAFGIIRSPNPLDLVASESTEDNPFGTASISNTGDSGTTLDGECSLLSADPEISLASSAFSVEQGTASHEVTIFCDATNVGAFSATLSCTHNGTNVSSPRNYPVTCEILSNFEINAGLNDAWVNEDAPFQGMFITVFPTLKLVFLAWFTFDSEVPVGEDRAVLGADDQRWASALGTYSGNRAELTAELSTGGVFNSSEPLANQDTSYGTVSIEFESCNLANVDFNFPTANLSGSFVSTRVLDSNVPLCEMLAE